MQLTEPLRSPMAGAEEDPAKGKQTLRHLAHSLLTVHLLQMERKLLDCFCHDCEKVAGTEKASRLESDNDH